MDINPLMMCIFPYYETVIFVRILQVINVYDPTNRWHWLFKAQKAGSPLTKDMVFTHWGHYQAFRNFINSYLKKFLKVISL